MYISIHYVLANPYALQSLFCDTVGPCLPANLDIVLQTGDGKESIVTFDMLMWVLPEYWQSQFPNEDVHIT